MAGPEVKCITKTQFKSQLVAFAESGGDTSGLLKFDMCLNGNIDLEILYFLKKDGFRPQDLQFVYPDMGDAPIIRRGLKFLRMLANVSLQVIFKASVIHLRDHINNSIGPEGFVQPCTVKFFPFLVRQVLFRDKGVGALCDGGFFHLIILLPAAGERRKASRWSFVIGGIRIIGI